MASAAVGRQLLPAHLAPVHAGPVWPVHGLPVHVSGSLDTDWLMFGATILGAVITLGLFVATFMMARKTAELATDTVDAADRADVHHQQALWPNVVPTQAHVQGADLSITLENIGNGPAYSVTVVISPEVRAADGGQSFRASPLAACGKQQCRWEVEGLLSRYDEPFYIRVQYDTMFGTTGAGDWIATPTNRYLANSARYVAVEPLHLTQPGFAKLRAQDGVR